MDELLHYRLERSVDVFRRPITIDLDRLLSKLPKKTMTKTYYFDGASFPKVIYNRRAFLVVGIESLPKCLWVVVDPSRRLCALAETP